MRLLLPPRVLRALCALLVPASLAVPAGALAAPSSRVGTLSQLHGRGGCLISFTRTSGSGQLAQQTGTSACAIYVLAVGCSLARTLRAPEGLAVSPDGASVYAAAFGAGAIAVFNLNASSGALIQKPRRAGCMTTGAVPDCTPGRALRGVSSLVVSPDDRYLYAAAFASDAVSVFKRATR